MKVLKFGGSSVANSENIKKVLAIVANESKNQKIAVLLGKPQIIYWLQQKMLW
jgi:aspartokinase/homoserine dehydrogenase 1